MANRYRLEVDVVTKILGGDFTALGAAAKKEIDRLRAELGRGVPGAEVATGLGRARTGMEADVQRLYKEGKFGPAGSKEAVGRLEQAQKELNKVFSLIDKDFKALVVSLREAGVAVIPKQSQVRRLALSEEAPSLTTKRQARRLGAQVVDPEQQKLLAKEEADEAAVLRKFGALVREALLAQKDYIRATRDVTRANRQLGAVNAALLANDQRYVTATAHLARARQTLGANVGEVLASDRRHIDANARLASARARLTIATLTQLSQNTTFAREQGDLRKVRSELRGAENYLLLGNKEARASLAALDRSRRALKASVDEENSRSKEDIASRTQSKKAGLRAQAGVQEGISADPSAIEDERTIKRERKRRARAEKEAALASEAGKREIAEDAVQSARINEIRSQAVRAHRQQLAGLERATRFQRLQASMAARGGIAGGGARDPLSFPSLGQFIGQKAITTAGFALSAISFRGAIQGVQLLVSEAEKLERIFNQIDAQFRSIGQAGEFAGFKDEILSIARATGQATDEVAFVAFQMKGVFGQDTTTAARQTESAIKIARVTGLELSEVVDSLTAASLGFGISIEQVGDKALGLQERFGVLARESIKVFGDIGAVAAQSGLDIDELGAIIGILQQRSARAGSALAEGLGRVLPAIQQRLGEIYELALTAPQLAPQRDTIAAAIDEGRTGDVLIELSKAYTTLDKSVQNHIVNLLGGRREAQYVIPVLANLGEVVKRETEEFDDAGRLLSYFEKLQETVAQRLARTKEAFAQLGEALFRAGLKDILVSAADAGRIFLTVLNAFTNVLALVNQATGGWGIRLVAIIGSIRLLTAGMAALGRLSAWKLMMAGGAAGGRGALSGWGAAYRAGAGTSPIQQAAWPSAASGIRGGVQSVRGGLGGLDPKLAALGITKGSLALLAGLAVTNELTELSNEVNSAEEELRASIQEAFTTDNEERVATIREIAKARTTTGDLLLDWLQREFKPDPAQVVGEEYAKQIAEKYKHIVAALKDLEPGRLDLATLTALKGEFEVGPDQTGEITGANTEAEAQANLGIKILRWAHIIDKAEKRTVDIDELVKQAQDGSVEAAKKLQDLVEGFREQDPQAFQRAEILAGESVREEILAGLDPAEKAFVGIAEATALYEEGAITAAAMLDHVRRILPSIQERLRKAGGAQANPELAGRVGSLLQLQRQLVTEVLKNSSDYIKSIAEGLGRWSPQDEVNRLAQLLGDVSPALDKMAAGQVAAERVTHQIGLQNAFMSGKPIPLAAPRAPIATLSDKEKLELGTAYLAQARESWFKDLRKVSDPTALVSLIQQGITLDQDAVDTIVEATRARYGDVTAEATRAVLEGKGFAADAAEEARRIRSELNQSISALKKSKIYDPVAIADEDVRLAQLELDIARESGDPAKINQAEAALNSANTSAQAERDRVAEVRIRYNRARLGQGENVLEDALAQQRAAKHAVDTAKGEAAEMEAAIQTFEADQSVQDAMVTIGEARVNLLIAMAEAAGDEVAVARYQAGLAADAYRRALATPGTGREVLDTLKAQVVSSNDALAAARVGQTRELIDFQLDMGEITVGQAIAQLTALLASPDVQSNQDRIRDIRRAIKSLQEQTSQDLQFNIGDLRIPTLYEVRRTMASAEAGIGYNDNRQVSVNIVVNNSGDLDGALAAFSELVNAPSRYGTSPRAFAYRN